MEKKEAAPAKFGPPKVGPPKNDYIFKGLKGVNEQIAILSCLHYKDMIPIIKSSRYAFNFVMDQEVTKRIGCHVDREDESKVQAWVMKQISILAQE